MCFGTVLSLTHPMHRPSLSISRLGALLSALVSALSFAASAQSQPTAPSGLTAAPLDAQAFLSWTYPSDSTVTSYSVRVATSTTVLDSISWAAIPGSTAVSTTHTVTGLANGLRYYFQIRAHNAVGHGAESAVATIQLAASPSAPVTIGDSNVRTALEAEIGKAAGATITQLDMSKLRGRLELENKDISVLAGLEHAVNLDFLDLDRNAISDVIALGSLTGLRTLFLRENAIADVAALGSLTRLEWLYLNENTIADVTALRGLTQLKLLALGGNEISDVAALGGLTSLTQLSLDRNAISDVTALGSLIRLTQLSLRDNAIADLTALGSLTSLVSLDLSGTAIADLTALVTALRGLASLRALALDRNEISDVTALRGLTSLTWLSLRDNAIADLTALGSLTSLASLNLSGTAIADLTALVTALRGLTSLTQLSLDRNGISDVTALGSLTSLTALSLNGNVISDVTALVNLTSLAQLGLYDNPLSAASIHTHIPAIESHGTAVSWLRTPQLPSYLTATAGNGSVTLRWRNPGDPSISRYEVRYRSTCLASFSEWAPIAGSHSRTVKHVLPVHGDLARGVFELRAVNVAGTGSASSARIGAPYSDVLDAVLGNAEVSLSWDAFSWHDSELPGSTSYSMRYTTGDWTELGSLAWIPVVADVSSDVCRREHKVSGLANGTRYWFQIRGTNAAGYSYTLFFTRRLAAFPSAVVTINDSNLRTALEGEIGKAAGATITQLDMAELRGELGLESKGISALTGLEHAVNLFALNLRGNAISDVTALGNLTQLDALYLDDNLISDVTALGNLTRLGRLSLARNAISDVTALGSLTRLWSLSLAGNAISDVTALGNLTGLTFLNLASNAISDVTALASNLGLDEDFNPRWVHPEPDYVYLESNPLSAASINQHIPAIQARGAVVWFDARPTNAPSAPTHLTANAGEGRVTLRWADPLDAYVDRYELRQGPGQPPAFGQWLAIAGSSRRTTEHVVPVAGDGRHTFQLRAVNFVGAGAAASVGVLFLFDDSLRMPLGSLFAAGGELSFRATSSDESVATVRVIDGELVVEPAYAGDGTTQIEVVATDATGRSTESRFNVRVEFIWPARATGGWRGAFLMLE